MKAKTRKSRFFILLALTLSCDSRVKVSFEAIVEPPEEEPRWISF